MSHRNTILLVILSFLFVFLTSYSTETAKFHKTYYENSIPDNDLWKQDCLDCKGLANTVTQETFERIIDTAYEVYKPIADLNKEELLINKNWEDPTVNANCLRSEGTVEINMYGGLARREEITPEGFTLVLCHELSHAYGGTPYIRTYSRMSAEGQADYKATLECAKRVFPKLNPKGLWVAPTDFMIKACNYDKVCLSSLVGGQSLGNLLAVIKEEDAPNYETPDPLVVPKTLLSYPATTQCRLDTYFNGALSKDRPLCWFKP